MDHDHRVSLHVGFQPKQLATEIRAEWSFCISALSLTSSIVCYCMWHFPPSVTTAAPGFQNITNECKLTGGAVDIRPKEIYLIGYCHPTQEEFDHRYLFCVKIAPKPNYTAKTLQTNDSRFYFLIGIWIQLGIYD